MGTVVEDADLVLAVRGGDQAAFATLFERWSDRCFDVARRIVHDEGIAAEVAQDVMLVAWQQLDSLRDPGAFGGWVLRSTRNRALNRLERERRTVTTPDDAPILALAPAADTPEREVEATATALDHRELVTAATAALGEREVSVLDLHLRHGLSAAEVADELGVTTNNAHQLIFRMKKKLSAGIRAWVLVRGGRPRCDELAAVLAAASATTFGPAAVKVIDRHVEGCADCRGRQAAVLDPAALFAAVPVVAVPAALRTGMVDALLEAGVPVAEGPPATDPSPDQPTPAEAGSDADAVGAANDPPTPDEVAARRRRHLRRAVVAAAAVLLLLTGTAALLTDGDDDADVAAGAPITETADAGADHATTAVGRPRSGSSTTTTATALAAPGTPPTDPTDERDDHETPTSTAPTEAGPATTAPANAAGTTSAPPTVAVDPTTTTTTAPPRPLVRRFDAVTATSRGGDCPPARYATTLWWLVDDATEVTIEAVGVTSITGQPRSGKRVVCRFPAGPPSGGWTLTATGPGGIATASA